MSLNSTITIFKHSILTHDKNFALDKNGSELAIEDYLATLESQSVSNFQYVKQGLSLVIKLNMSQLNLDLIESNDWNYCKIQNDGNRPLYYFVIKKEWLSKETIAFTLTMDTLNSFSFNNDYIVNKKTTIQRQHKDRIKYLRSMPRLDERIRFGERVPEDESGYYTYPVGYIFSHSFTPVSGTKTYTMEYAQESVDPLDPQPPSNWGNFPPELKPFYDMENGIYGAEVIAPFTVYASHIMDEYVYISLLPNDDIFIRDVDLVSEGFNVPVYKEELGQIEDETNNETWYLLYRNRDNPNPEEQFNDSPVECYLIPSTPLRAVNNSPIKLLNVNNTDSGKWYMFEVYYDNRHGENISFKIGDEVFQPKEIYKDETQWEYASVIRHIFVFHNVSGTSIQWTFYNLHGIFNSNGSIRSQSLDTLKSGTLTSSDNIELISPYNSILPYVANSNPTTGYDINEYKMPSEFSESNRINFSAQSSVYTKDVTSLDRTDSRNIKLIALPYCPAQTSSSVIGINILSNFRYDSTTGWFKSLDVTTPFKNTFTTNLNNSPLNTMILVAPNLGINGDRNDYLESKLFHSDFYRPKFVYDSFNYTYCLERYDLSTLPEEKTFGLGYDVTFVMTRTINSKFLFQLDTTYLTHSMDDYDGVVAVSRNNEEVLFNSAYINYVRSGFNYDKKSLARRQETAGWTIGLSVASAVLGIIGSVATQNPLPAVLGIAGAGVGITSQIVSNIQTQAQGEQTIQQKLEEANRQAVAVAGSDDIDLLTAYSNNKAKLVLYQVSERMKKLIGDLFYYCGYKLELQDIPDKDSRYWFNFVQCDLVVNYDSNVPSDIMNDLIERFKQGVTFFHYHNGFDLAQEKENLEISLVNR